ncbi:MULTISPECIES: TetR family transcriptional regulator [Nostocales]|uniref:TetR/AcrR family transcriptional regulator n=3 Tax=Nostocales TaxID=1161 RepID=A0A8S9T110_9CYAN|nr:TetR family transcriptional regulator [Tolypothrix bouteillei]KAF3886035.1 TetR/AcrR family transcriptional regulator [Tolypothrix bouteillei VB521301]
MAQTERTARETQELILATAEAHLRRYGYARTTVSEIARACKMSHANVYRFFKTKADVMDAVVQRWFSGVEQALQEMTQKPNSAAECLEAYVLGLYRLKRDKLAAEPELFDAYLAILEVDRTAPKHHLQVLSSILQGILTRGVESGEFQIADLSLATIAINAATLKFHHPLMIRECAHEPLEEQAIAVVKLLTVSLTAGKI